MKRSGILHGQLMQQIACLGHTDTFLIGDAGMPVPSGVPIIDLALTLGIPTFEQVLRAVCGEVVIEAATIAVDTKQKNPAVYELVHSLVSEQVTEIVHTELKLAVRNCKFAIRTGESTPYANVILRAGVAFTV